MIRPWAFTAILMILESVYWVAPVIAWMPDAGSMPTIPDARLAPHTVERDARAHVRAREMLNRHAMSFEVNLGQTDPAVRFLARGQGYTLFLTSTDAVMIPHERREAHAARYGSVLRARRATSLPTRAEKGSAAVFRMQFAGANPTPKVEGLEELPGTLNYFIGSDPARWRTNVPRFARVKYEDVYPGIDVVYYYGQHGELEYDFIVAPGANPDLIRLTFEGADRIDIDDRGDVVVASGGGHLRLRRPVTFQDLDGHRREIANRYAMQSTRREDGRHVHHVRFQLAAYDASRPLVIDPTIVYSTYLGGSVSGDVSAENGAEGIAVDGGGHAYVTGFTNAVNFPTAGAIQGLEGRFNAFVTRFGPDGTLVYSTYLGGMASDECGVGALGFAIAVDSGSNAYVMGATDGNFPTTPFAFQTVAGRGINVFVSKLSPSGSTLIYSTYLGGKTGSQPVELVPGGGITMGIAVDSAGQAHVVGNTNATDFPTRNAVQPTLAEGFEGFAARTPAAIDDCLGAPPSFAVDYFVTKLNAHGSDIVYSTYLGGAGIAEVSARIALDPFGNASVAGVTDSRDFPTLNPIQSEYKGGFRDAFVTKFDAQGRLVYSTYLGGSDDDFASAVAVDSASNTYVVGSTSSTDFPVKNPLQTRLIEDPSRLTAFVTKLNAGGTELVYSTHLGSSDPLVDCSVFNETRHLPCIDGGYGVAVDATGNAYVTGFSTARDFPVTAGAIQGRFAGGGLDAFVAKLDATASMLLYSSYLGGAADDVAQDIALDPATSVLVVGQTDSIDFPIARAFQPGLAGRTDAFVAKLNLSPTERAPLEFVTFPAVLPSLPPTAAVGQPYVGNVGISGGQPPYAVRVVRGALPQGLTLASQDGTSSSGTSAGGTASRAAAGGDARETPANEILGRIIGTPTEIGEACFEVAVADPLETTNRIFRITTRGPGGPVLPDTRTLRVTRSGPGQGMVEALLAATVERVPCTDGCTLPYGVCGRVQLTAAAAAGSIFAGWTGGDCAGTGGCEFLIKNDVTVTAHFEIAESQLVAAVLPSSRSVQVGSVATVSATMIATGPGLATGCRVELDGGAPVTLMYQPYDPRTGQVTGPVNVPVSLMAGVPQALLLALTPTATLDPTELALRFTCSNMGPATPIPGVNTLLLSAGATAPPDIVVLVATPTSNGIVRVDGVPGAAAFAVATVNVGTGSELTLSADTGGSALPGVSLLVCETAPATGQCVAGLGTGARRRIEAGQTPTYTVVVLATSPVELDPAKHRVFVRFRDEAGVVRGSASVALHAAQGIVPSSEHRTAQND